MVEVQPSNMPKSLYLLSIACVGSNLHKRPSDKNVLRTLPDNVLMDIYYTVSIPLYPYIIYISKHVMFQPSDKFLLIQIDMDQSILIKICFACYL